MGSYGRRASIFCPIRQRRKVVRPVLRIIEIVTISPSCTAQGMNVTGTIAGSGRL